ncbi:MAG: hypothetical protein M1828_003646 [Chrysothrix sp. TS-e1954]|nr:MAG: hypothetical protein M1828_003646 [Chrysothrix sp. TS-e1954]
MAARSVLVVGATRGLGASLASKYASASAKVFATARSTPKDTLKPSISWINNVDVSTESAGPTITKGLSGTKLDTVILAAGYFGKESFEELDYEKQLTMYKISAIGPTFIVSSLVKAGLLSKGSKIILITSESGSITLRHESEGGGMYGHHASKAAENMVGKLLSLDLKDKEIAVGMVHPGFMRTEMTKSVGFDKFWDEAGAITPDEAADSLIDWIKTFDMSKTGTYWSPTGPKFIGTAEPVMGPTKNLPTPLELPW